MGLDFSLALQGRLKPFLEEEIRIVVGRSNQVTRRNTTGLKESGRQEVRSKLRRRRRGAGRGRDVANAVRGIFFNEDDGTVTGLVFSKFGRRERGQFIDYFALFELGGTLKPTRSQYMMIDLRSRRQQGKPLSVLFEQKNVRWIQISANRAVLVRQTRTRSTLLAIFIKRAVIRKRLNFKARVDRAERQFFAELAAELAKD